ncbi:endonuclease [Myroides odoratimimus]|uniref:endonuclease I family protein n=1 Tax=Myroides odoratimimus TaxID=76832 RepID=UPI00103C7812|nr:endonuclease [Myroides odoratimimus]QBK76686.1 endonuclease [Myroides odoratimimus]WHT72098.1 endonuclease [Myroides odoratimimus]WHU36680.1 endonuclease [Myroides odoratimimus]
MKKTLLVLAGLAVFATSCTKDPIITEPTEKPGNGGGEKPDEGGNITPNPGDYIIPAQYQQYYSKLDFTKEGTLLKQQLAKLVKDTHIPQTYTPGMWEATEFTDEDPENKNNVLQIYSWPDKDAKNDITKKRSVPKEHKNDKSTNLPLTSLWEREHVFAKALATDKTKNQKALITVFGKNSDGSDRIPTTSEEIAGHDAHHLRAINRSTNSSRSNNKFVDGSGNSKKVGKEYYFPGDEWKGDVARMMMYMHIRYENENGGGYTKATKVGMPRDAKAGVLSDEMIDLFLKWNAEDPVDEIERRRNEYHGNPNNPNYRYSQGNRNPFIDNPELANRIWGGPKAENKWSK